MQVFWACQTEVPRQSTAGQSKGPSPPQGTDHQRGYLDSATTGPPNKKDGVTCRYGFGPRLPPRNVILSESCAGRHNLKVCSAQQLSIGENRLLQRWCGHENDSN